MSAKTSKQYKIVRDINKALANPHLYTDEELRTLKKKKHNSLISNDATMTNNSEVLDSMYDEQFDVTWDENDMIQVMEDDWVSSIIGTEEEAIYDVLAEIK